MSLSQIEHLTYCGIKICFFIMNILRHPVVVQRNTSNTMEMSMVIVLLVLLLCVTVPILILAACLIYCLLSRKVKNNEKQSMTCPTSSNIDTATVETAFDDPRSHGHSSVAIGYDNVLNADDPPTAVFSFTRTPFGTRTTATFDLGTSLRASWTTNGQSQGPDTLAAALEGVLALHRRLEDLRLQQNEDQKNEEIEYHVKQFGIIFSLIMIYLINRYLTQF